VGCRYRYRFFLSFLVKSPCYCLVPRFGRPVIICLLFLGAAIVLVLVGSNLLVP
jgi:hypothetical protein